VTDKEIDIPLQKPVPAKLEQWSMGIPDRRIGFKDPAWDWKSNWKQEMGGRDKKEIMGMSAAGPSAEAILTFSGSAVSIQGILNEEGGRADVLVDGKKARVMDAYMVPRTHDSSLWHVYGLKPGQHTIRIVARDDTDPRSQGKKIAITEAVVYRDK
jgi:hypothetical protein